ncbi:MAG: hypothetical protein H5T76_26525, partial [Streptomyces sp.]|nr:hypothetical protein [Streptomyces sp.]
PARRAVIRRRERVMGMIDTLPPSARRAIERTHATAPTLPLPSAGTGTLPAPGTGTLGRGTAGSGA